MYVLRGLPCQYHVGVCEPKITCFIFTSGNFEGYARENVNQVNNAVTCYYFCILPFRPRCLLSKQLIMGGDSRDYCDLIMHTRASQIVMHREINVYGTNKIFCLTWVPWKGQVTFTCVPSCDDRRSTVFGCGFKTPVGPLG